MDAVAAGVVLEAVRVDSARAVLGVPGDRLGPGAGFLDQAAVVVVGEAGFDHARGAAGADVLEAVAGVVGVVADGAGFGVGLAVAHLVVDEALVVDCARIVGTRESIFRVIGERGRARIRSSGFALGQDVAEPVPCIRGVVDHLPGDGGVGELRQSATRVPGVAGGCGRRWKECGPATARRRRSGS